MSMERVEIPSDNSLGLLPCFVTTGDHKSAVIVLQEVITYNLNLFK